MSFKFFSPASLIVLLAFIFGTFWGMKIYSDRNRDTFLEKQRSAVRVLTYKNLFSPELKKALAQDDRFAVDYREVDTAEELWDVLENPGPLGRPDVITLFSSQIPLASQLGWLQALNRSRVPNLAWISPDFLDLPGDPSLHQVAPLLWGVTGMVQKSDSGLESPSWREALQNSKLKGKIALPNSTVEVLRAGLSSAGSAAIPVAANGLKKILQPVFTNAKISDQILSTASLAGEMKVLTASNGEMAFAPYKNSDWKFSLPNEKATLWILSLALSREPRDEKKAYAFLNAVLDVRAARSFVDSFHQASPHRGLLGVKELDPRLKPNYLRQIPFESFVLWTDGSRAREVRGLIEEAKAGKVEVAPEPTPKKSAPVKSPPKRSPTPEVVATPAVSEPSLDSGNGN